MNAMLKMSQLIDGLNERVGRSLMWLVLFAVVISAVNAVVRKAFDMSSNAFLEIQWYLFAAVVMLGSAYTMLRQGHVKIDVIVGRFSKRTQTIVECVGIVFFLFPFHSKVISVTQVPRPAGGLDLNVGVFSHSLPANFSVLPTRLESGHLPDYPSAFPRHQAPCLSQ
jgi:hypothetical protein